MNEDDKTPVSEHRDIVLRELADRWNPKIAKLIPQFMYRKLHRTLHLDQINTLLRDTRDFGPQEFLDRLVNEEFKLRLSFRGREKIDALKGRGDLIFAANHPIGGPEGFAIAQQLLPDFPDLKIMIQSMLGVLKPLKPIAVYNGTQLHSTLDAVRRHDPLMIFPAGYCSRRLKNGEIFDLSWKATFVKLAQRYNHTIVPIHISGRLGERMYRWYGLRRFFGMKMSVETLFLVDEMYRFSGGELQFTVGDPISPGTLTSDVTPDEWANRIRQYVHALGSDPDAGFDPELPNTYHLEEPL